MWETRKHNDDFVCPGIVRLLHLNTFSNKHQDLSIISENENAECQHMSLVGHLCLQFAIQHLQKEREEIGNNNNQHMVEIRGINYHSWRKCDC